eukprot:1374297-Rhodomonas_salina.1
MSLCLGRAWTQAGSPSASPNRPGVSATSSWPGHCRVALEELEDVELRTHGVGQRFKAAWTERMAAALTGAPKERKADLR